MEPPPSLGARQTRELSSTDVPFSLSCCTEVTMHRDVLVPSDAEYNDFVGNLGESGCPTGLLPSSAPLPTCVVCQNETRTPSSCPRLFRSSAGSLTLARDVASAPPWTGATAGTTKVPSPQVHCQKSEGATISDGERLFGNVKVPKHCALTRRRATRALSVESTSPVQLPLPAGLLLGDGVACRAQASVRGVPGLKHTPKTNAEIPSLENDGHTGRYVSPCSPFPPSAQFPLVSEPSPQNTGSIHAETHSETISQRDAQDVSKEDRLLHSKSNFVTHNNAGTRCSPHRLMEAQRLRLKVSEAPCANLATESRKEGPSFSKEYSNATNTFHDERSSFILGSRTEGDLLPYDSLEAKLQSALWEQRAQLLRHRQLLQLRRSQNIQRASGRPKALRGQHKRSDLKNGFLFPSIKSGYTSHVWQASNHLTVLENNSVSLHREPVISGPLTSVLDSNSIVPPTQYTATPDQSAPRPSCQSVRPGVGCAPKGA